MDADMMTFSMCINVCAEMYQYINVPINTVGRCTTDRKEPGVNICEEAILLNYHMHQHSASHFFFLQNVSETLSAFSTRQN
jgi:hypothetical protein